MGRFARPSIAFHLWVRLTVVMAVFVLVAVGAFVWLEIDDRLTAARQYTAAQANAAVRPYTQRLIQTGSVPELQQEIGQSLGIVTIIPLDAEGNAIETADGPPSDLQLAQLLPPGNVKTNFDLRIKQDEVLIEALNPLDLLVGGGFGALHVVPWEPRQTPGVGPQPPPRPRGAAAPATEPPVWLAAILEYEDIALEAQTLLLRSLALATGMLIVASMSIWVLLQRFVSRPLGAYNRIARRIAEGELSRMPDLSIREFDQLGQTIDEMADALREQASIDALTGLYNTRHLVGHLPDLIARAEVIDRPLALLVCDLNNLKPVNDTYGHPAGDLVLQAVAERMLRFANERTLCWRTGGDEFAVALPGVGKDGASPALESLQRAIEAGPLLIEGHTVEISVSIGHASFPKEAGDIAGLRALADQRMYEAKALVHERQTAA